MTKKLLVALLLIGLTVAVIIMNRGRIDVDIIVTEFRCLKPLAFLGFAAIGVIIGVLLK